MMMMMMIDDDDDRDDDDDDDDKILTIGWSGAYGYGYVWYKRYTSIKFYMQKPVNGYHVALPYSSVNDWDHPVRLITGQWYAR